MSVWVEDSAVVDVDGVFYRRVGSGVASGGKNSSPDAARGWRKGIGGNERTVVGAKIPVRIYVRWQSLVEPQSYQGWFEIPESARQIMHDAVTKDCPEYPELKEIRAGGSVQLGLAPGGIVQIWVRDQCQRPVKVARGQAEIVPLGPDLGRSGGNYFPLEDASKRYVEKYGIPYGSW
ncbi:DUF2931 family protein [Pseudomonas frederiksbergensis]|nr:DUF2931 family protein [Pseudomonas frederiksbergensis]